MWQVLFCLSLTLTDSIGCGLDRLQWSKVSEMLEQVFKHTDISITVYSLPEKAETTVMKENKRRWLIEKLVYCNYVYVLFCIIPTVCGHCFHVGGKKCIDNLKINFLFSTSKSTKLSWTSASRWHIFTDHLISVSKVTSAITSFQPFDKMRAAPETH